MDYEYISWNHFYRLCGRLYHRVSGSGFEPQLIVAIARGGYPVARVLADFFGSMNLISLKIEHYHGPDKLARATIPYPRPLPVDGRRVLGDAEAEFAPSCAPRCCTTRRPPARYRITTRSVS